MPGHSQRLKRGDDNELEKNLKLENVVDSEHLRLAMETDEERRARLENVAATKLLSLAMEMDKERKSRPEKVVATAQLMLALTKGVVNVGVVLSLNPFWKVANNIGTHNWKKYRSWIIVCLSHSSFYILANCIILLKRIIIIKLTRTIHICMYINIVLIYIYCVW